MSVIKKITIMVSKMKEMVRFYGKTFDIDFFMIDTGSYKMYYGTMDKIKLLFCPKKISGIDVNENNIRLQFMVKDISQTLNNALDWGGTELEPIKNQNNTLFCSLKDPDGNALELIQVMDDKY